MSKFIVSEPAKKLVTDHLKSAKETACAYFEALASLTDLEYYASSYDVYHEADAKHFAKAWKQVRKMKVPKEIFVKGKD